jgi:site-specific DNA recombinase
VSRCLRKPRYAGLASYKKEPVGVGQWPALVDSDTWHAAQAVMRNPARRPTRGDQRLLTGIARCGVCEATVHAGGGATGRGVYRCSGSTGHVIRKRQPVDDFITAVVLERLSRSDARVLTAPKDTSRDAAQLLQQADEARQRLDGLSEAYADGALTLSQLRKGSERLRTTIAGIEGQLGALDTGYGKELRRLVDAGDITAAWSASSLEAQRGIIDRLMIIRLQPPGRGVRTLEPDTVLIEWRQS